MEVYKNLPEGTLAELIDNVIYRFPSSVKIHQQVLQTIFRRLSETIEDTGKGEITIAHLMFTSIPRVMQFNPISP